MRSSNSAKGLKVLMKVSCQRSPGATGVCPIRREVIPERSAVLAHQFRRGAMLGRRQGTDYADSERNESKKRSQDLSSEKHVIDVDRRATADMVEIPREPYA